MTSLVRMRTGALRLQTSGFCKRGNLGLFLDENTISVPGSVVFYRMPCPLFIKLIYMQENQYLAKIQVETSDPRLHAYLAGEGKGTADVRLFFCAPPTLGLRGFCKRSNLGLFLDENTISLPGSVVFYRMPCPLFIKLIYIWRKTNV